jgi:IS30 family transposase
MLWLSGTRTASRTGREAAWTISGGVPRPVTCVWQWLRSSSDSGAVSLLAAICFWESVTGFAAVQLTDRGARSVAPGHTRRYELTQALGDFNLIGLRPDEANRRDQVGHLEGDLIFGSFNRSAIATLFDRTSRFVWLADLPDGHGAQAVLAALIETLERIPEELRRTLTWDQGSEMAAHAELAEATGIDVYFADPHSPWQRPTNENGNGNGLIRRYVAKGTNLNVYKTEDLRRIETRINTMPRRSLGWSTAHDGYHQAVALTV